MTKRHFWQIHLSTAVVLMFAAGGLLWASCKSSKDSHFGVLNIRQSGWPWPFFKWNTAQGDPTIRFSWSSLTSNIAVALGVLLVLAILFEYLAQENEAGRRGLRPHTWTTILLLLCFLGLIWLNQHSGKYEYWSHSNHYGRIRYGWPWPAMYTEFYCEQTGASPLAAGYDIDERIQSSERRVLPHDYGALASNLAVGVGILLFIALLFESLIRRREARKP